MNTHPTPIFTGSFRKNLLLLIMAFAVQFIGATKNTTTESFKLILE